MALIDTFLKLMVEKRAERLVLVSDTVPYLLKAGETLPLSMPPLGEEILKRLSSEISGDSPPDGGKPRREGTFRATDGSEFGYFIDSSDPHRIEVQTLDAPPPVENPVIEEAVARAMAKPAPSSEESAPLTTTSGTQPDPDLLLTIDKAVAMEASDIFLSSGKPPRARVKGLITRIDAYPPQSAEILRLLPDEEIRRDFEKAGSTDFAVRWELPGGSRRFRINVFRHLDGVAAAVRPIRQRIPTLAELNLPDSLLDLVSFHGGLVLVTGTSGSGKSTTLAALIDHLNRSRPRHVITIEDPIEFEHREVQCLIHQREVGADVESFSSGLRAALRENPDVILLGELRDLDTISAALTAAETGHLVLGTLHSGSASSAVNRIIDVFPGHQQSHVRAQLAASLRAVVSQRLVPTRSGAMIPVLEKMLVTPAVANGIREGHEHYLRNAMLTGSDEGMITLERSLSAFVRKGTIDLDTAMRHAADQKALMHQLE
ncbi:PilT/PilU family type 4a pilus ATPase [Luteolibacter ambystomatis]|uniref:PilT/PilU family type 4a pilus ATPase n=1 Tax=Luteolibacter ambystomatis TaxID=2824561 RepID=A0A975J0Y9_9BACT|nr:PilT/PilU family type 4a pilus ATPase [Luteolibacter ambystomatis]QUE52021.1 PilT/PilU family type 4a pilus ATPase [Luteolibacter ambystomatis]